MATLTLNSIRNRQVNTEQAAPKVPAKKSNIIDIAAYIDGVEYRMSFTAAMSSQLMSGQKNAKTISDIFNRALAQQFGKVEKL